MKLYFFKSSSGRINFGDDLNPWMWERLGLQFDNQGSAFVGIGTLLNDRLVTRLADEKKIVFGSGVGYGDKVPQLDQNWKIYCVRGPLTARALGISEELAITDSAILLTDLIDTKPPHKYLVSYMPHVSNDNAGWRRLCSELGIHYISPNAPVEEVIRQIHSSGKIITEAMHGAIVADALRVPWLPVTTTSEILAFKWNDWCASMELEYSPKKLVRIWGLGKGFTGVARYIAKSLFAKHKLIYLKNEGKYYLSEDEIFRDRLNRLRTTLDQLKTDLATGRVY